MDPPPLGVESTPHDIKTWRSKRSQFVSTPGFHHPWPPSHNNRICQLRQIHFYSFKKTGVIFNTVYSKNPLENGPASAHLAALCENGKMLLELVMLDDTSGAPSLDTSRRLPSRDVSMSTPTGGIVPRLDRDGMPLQAGRPREPPRHVVVARFNLPSDEYHTSIYMIPLVQELCIILEPRDPQVTLKIPATPRWRYT